ncbi:MAG: hypothetical protein ACAF41_16425 [Leptolyngbya sp. BL-A-14]
MSFEFCVNKLESFELIELLMVRLPTPYSLLPTPYSHLRLLPSASLKLLHENTSAKGSIFEYCLSGQERSAMT